MNPYQSVDHTVGHLFKSIVQRQSTETLKLEDYAMFILVAVTPGARSLLTMTEEYFGRWMEKDKSLLYYYNNYDGHKNVSFHLST